MAPRKSTSPLPKRKASKSGKVKKNAKKPSGLKLGKVVAVAPAVLSPGPMSPITGTTQTKGFRFLELPGGKYNQRFVTSHMTYFCPEIRNKIYKITLDASRQVLLKHLPKRATLRPRPQPTNPFRRSRRPYVGLTQVCRQIRAEYHPWYMGKLDVAMDLTEINDYFETFYPITGKKRDASNDDLIGNVTIALNYIMSPQEKDPKGVDIWPVLDCWANYYRIELGLGRYGDAGYYSEVDGEAKDVYRLVCRTIYPGKVVGPVNQYWRDILREQKLAAVRIHRAPAAPDVPYFHILFKQECKEAWMTQEVSDPPADWLERHGFDDMEYFGVKVGAVSGN